MKKTTVMLGIVVLLAVAGLFLFNGKTTGKTITGTKLQVEFTVNAFRFGYSPDTITVNQGDKVKISINNTDTLHGIIIPELGIGGDDIIEFTAYKTGEFVWYCANMCGKGHMQMQGKLIVK